MMSQLFDIGLVACLAALVTSVLALVTGKRVIGTFSISLLAAGAISLAAYMAVRWVQAQQAPFSNMYESLVVFAWSIAVVYLLFRRKLGLAVLDTAVSLMVVLVLAWASMHDSAIHPLMPALKSNWLTFHVMSCMLAYGGFTLSFVAAVCYLVAVRPGSSTAAGTLEKYESMLEKTVSFGFFFLTVGILTGSVWANRAWGSYWSWDPKETWSLVTWFAYAIFLHCRFIRGWRGVPGAVIAVVGFICVIITYVGVNFLMKSLHSYA